MLTIKESARVEFIEKKSKFIGWAKSIGSREEGEAFIQEIKRRHSDATNNCSVYKVIENGQEYLKLDDDGEPSGTAAKPMGEILTLMGIDNVVVVATRYFGGIKLGAGGLVRNYAKSAKLAILEGGIEEYIEKSRVIVDFDYDKSPEADAIIMDNNGIIHDKNYSERVTYDLEISKNGLEALKKVKSLIIL